MTKPLAFEIKGIVPIIPTPFRPNEEIDLDALGSVLDFAMASGVCSVCLPAYASEFYKLTEEERLLLVNTAVERLAGRLPVIAQVNHPSARQAATWAVSVQHAGASAISVAAPRLFPLTEDDLLRYFSRILERIEVPLLVQDVNPGGSTIGAAFVARLHRAYPHFRYVKLEEPRMAAKVDAVRNATGGEVGVLEGWGGLYMLELIRAGITGVMPGLAVADLLSLVYKLAANDQWEQAYCVYRDVLPQIVFSLQNMELFHHAEKALLEARGVLQGVTVRDGTVMLDEHDRSHIRFLNTHVLAALERWNLPRNPARDMAEASTNEA